jgi:transcriptional regulator with XRE-family HTH domain
MSSVKTTLLERLIAGLESSGIKRGTRNKTVAEKTGYSLDSVKRVLSGNATLTPRFIQAACSIFNINIDWVLKGTEPVAANEQTIWPFPTHDWTGQAFVMEGERLKKVREALGYSLEEMALQLNTDEISLHQCEQGVFVKDLRVLRKLALLGININWIMTGRGEMRLREEPVVIYKENTNIDSWGRSSATEYKIDGLFTTRIKRTLGNRTTEWLSSETDITVQKIEKIIEGETIPSVDELEAIAKAFDNINPAWLAEKSTIPSENWIFEYYRDDAGIPQIEILRLCEMAVDDYLGEILGLIKLPPEKKARIINVLFRLHAKESPGSKKINKEMVITLINIANQETALVQHSKT